LQAPIVFMPDTMRGSGKEDPLRWIAAKPEDRGNDAFLKLPLWLPRADDADSMVQGERNAQKLRETRESHRLLYVAMTRAEDRLYVGGFRGRKKAEGCWYELIKRGLEACGKVEGENLVLTAPQKKSPKKQKLAVE